MAIHGRVPHEIHHSYQTQYTEGSRDVTNDGTSYRVHASEIHMTVPSFDIMSWELLCIRIVAAAREKIA